MCNGDNDHLCAMFFKQIAVILYCMMTIMKCFYSRMYYSVCARVCMCVRVCVSVCVCASLCVCLSACTAQRVPVSNSITVLGSSVAENLHHGSSKYYLYYYYYYYYEYGCYVYVLWSQHELITCLQRLI